MLRTRFFFLFFFSSRDMLILVSLNSLSSFAWMLSSVSGSISACSFSAFSFFSFSLSGSSPSLRRNLSRHFNNILKSFFPSTFKSSQQCLISFFVSSISPYL
eukprot:Lithocolla_globosa_v1_NODE_1032_length_2930_cov_15.909217.p3 type:complete len:102 gc:universal NODE_1032_length_2930_cov_15.909217:1537-1842(+)